jgi:hypothetical protein
MLSSATCVHCKKGAPARPRACPYCTYHNTDDKRATCEMCYQKLPDGAPVAPAAAAAPPPMKHGRFDGFDGAGGGEWLCGFCQCSNAAALTTCKACTSKRP